VVSIPMMGLNNDHNVTSALSIAVYDWYSKYIKIGQITPVLLSA